MSEVNRFQQVAAEAYETWTAFETNPSLPFTNESLFDPSAQPVRQRHRATRGEANACVRAYFNYCARQRLGCARPVYVMIGNEIPAWTEEEDTEGRPASWLWEMGNNEPRILIDRSEVLQHVPPRYYDRFVTRLTLHEVAHMVLHWESLRYALRDHPMRPCTPQQEREAWWFCEVVIATALGQHAQLRRTPTEGRRFHDDTWLYS